MNDKTICFTADGTLKEAIEKVVERHPEMSISSFCREACREKLARAKRAQQRAKAKPAVAGAA